jgi:hypothetical protein
MKLYDECRCEASQPPSFGTLAICIGRPAERTAAVIQLIFLRFEDS